jgi:DNA processing protein
MNEQCFINLLISRTPEISSAEKILLSENINSEKDFIRIIDSNEIEKIINRRLKNKFDVDEIRKLAEQDEKKINIRKINYASYASVDYPPLLREIYDPPLILFYLGKLPCAEKPTAAIVGTRHPSPEASGFAYKISSDLGKFGISIVSGLAIGIDTMAHRGNIDGGASTIAVLGSGIDNIYPRSNKMLAKKILETGGAIISEYPMETPAYKWNFPARNRIISGISRGVVVVEAPQSSGALITARFAAEQNRDLWVASLHQEDKERISFDRRGSEKLVQQGAKLINNAEEILRDWNIEKVISKKYDDGERSHINELVRSLEIDL